MTTPRLLVGDIGGTNARFALADPKVRGFSRKKTLACEDFSTAELAIKSYLTSVQAPNPQAICFAVAGPVVDNAVRFTNNQWSIDAANLANDFGQINVALLNDFEAIAYAIPLIDEAASQDIGLPASTPLDTKRFTVGIVGPGTGLGYGGLALKDRTLVPIVGEGGHQGFAPESKVQMDILAALRERFDRVSDERLVSGPGLENIYWALCKIHNERQNELTAAEIFAASIDNRDSRAEEAVQLFFELLGQVAGNLALSIKATDGVYVAGGIAKRYPELLANSRFRVGFESKGRYRSLMEVIPTRLILHNDPGLLGASYVASKIYQGS